jgi:hyperosmotically inducible protein
VTTRTIGILLTLGSLLLLSGCIAVVAGGAAAGGYYVGKDERSVGEIADDAAITAKVKTLLIREKNIKSLDINVDTYRRVVTLNGKVRSRGERSRAVKLAKSVKSVEKVVSKLEIVRVPVEET